MKPDQTAHGTFSDIYNHAGLRVVHTLKDLCQEPFAKNEVWHLLADRGMLAGNFNALAVSLSKIKHTNLEGRVEKFYLRSLQNIRNLFSASDRAGLYKSQIDALDTIVRDMNGLIDMGMNPSLFLIGGRSYQNKNDKAIYQFHEDGYGGLADDKTVKINYNGPATEILCNEDAIPAGRDAAGSQLYTPRQGAVVVSPKLGDIWAMRCRSRKDCKNVLIHRAPKASNLRLMMHAVWN